jgi:hypothetical protein
MFLCPARLFNSKSAPSEFIDDAKDCERWSFRLETLSGDSEKFAIF